jgi:hypothetical protein
MTPEQSTRRKSQYLLIRRRWQEGERNKTEDCLEKQIQCGCGRPTNSNKFDGLAYTLRGVNDAIGIADSLSAGPAYLISSRGEWIS